MEPIVSDGRFRLRAWKTMSTRLPVASCIARLRASTVSVMAPQGEQQIARLTGDNWAILWKRGQRRKQPVRALFLRLHSAGIGTSITCAPIVSPFIALALVAVLFIVGFNPDIWDLAFAGVVLGVVAAYVLFGYLFSRNEGEMLMTFARQTLEAHDDR